MGRVTFPAVIGKAVGFKSASSRWSGVFLIGFRIHLQEAPQAPGCIVICSNLLPTVFPVVVSGLRERTLRFKVSWVLGWPLFTDRQGQAMRAP